MVQESIEKLALELEAASAEYESSEE